MDNVIGKTSRSSYFILFISGAFMMELLSLAHEHIFVGIPYNGYIYVYIAYILFWLNTALNAKSRKIILNDTGVWVGGGFFPWQKYRRGIRWEDIDMVTHSVGFLSWITNSYTISINHKYKNGKNLRFGGISEGRAVRDIIEAEREKRTKS